MSWVDTDLRDLEFLLSVKSWDILTNLSEFRLEHDFLSDILFDIMNIVTDANWKLERLYLKVFDLFPAFEMISSHILSIVLGVKIDINFDGDLISFFDLIVSDEFHSYFFKLTSHDCAFLWKYL